MADRSAVWGVLRLIVALSLFVAVSYGIDWLLRAENYPVQHVRFEGPFQRVSHPELEAVVLDHVRGNFFLVDLDAIRQRVEALPWVHRAVVRRQLPGDVAVRFTEQRLVARWNDNAWLNDAGEVVRLSDPDMPADLPRLAGPEETSAQVLASYREFRDAVAPLHLALAGLTLTPRRNWRLELEGEADDQRLALVVDQDQPRQRLERFARIYGTTLAAQADAIRQIDLRYTNGFAVEWQNGGGNAQMANRVAPRTEG